MSTHQSFVIDGLVYCIDGLGTVIAYDIGAKTWKSVASRPSGVDAAQVSRSGLLYGRKFYQFCGLTVDTNQVTSVCELYDLDTKKWTRLPNAPRARHRHCAVVKSNCIIALLGGIGDDSRPVHIIDEYDTRANAWVSTAPLSRGISDFGCYVDAAHQIALIGGYDDHDRYFDELHLTSFAFCAVRSI